MSSLSAAVTKSKHGEKEKEKNDKKISLQMLFKLLVLYKYSSNLKY